MDSIIATVLFIILPLGLIAFGVIDLFGDLGYLSRLLRRGRRAKDLLATGLRAPATVECIRQTNTFVNENPEVVLELQVRPVGSEGFPVNLRTVVPLVRVPRVQPGCVVTVAYNPSRTGEVALVPDGE